MPLGGSSAPGRGGSSPGQRYIPVGAPGAPAKLKEKAEPGQGDHVFNAVHELGLKIIRLADDNCRNPEEIEGYKNDLSAAVEAFRVRREHRTYGVAPGGKGDSGNSYRYGQLDAKTVAIATAIINGEQEPEPGHRQLINMERELPNAAVDDSAKKYVRGDSLNPALFDAWFEETSRYMGSIYSLVIELVTRTKKL